MVGVCFFFEDEDVDVWSGKDLDAWNYACKLAGDVDKAYVINKTNQTLQSFDVTMDFQVFDSLQDAEDKMQGVKVYLKCPWDTGKNLSIVDYDHNDSDWYVFGPAGGWDKKRSGYFIPQAGLGAAHSVHVATAVMYHRYWSINL